ncbi:hypothetical protein INR49_002359 [Caranx melampygus]|nr:hypothetical protein INR49_002359 [Caranx melampygus]
MCMSGSATSCEECLLIHTSLAGRTRGMVDLPAAGAERLQDECDFGRGRTLTSRCDFSHNLLKRGCDVRFIERTRGAASPSWRTGP